MGRAASALMAPRFGWLVGGYRGPALRRGSWGCGAAGEVRGSLAPCPWCLPVPGSDVAMWGLWQQSPQRREGEPKVVWSGPPEDHSGRARPPGGGL